MELASATAEQDLLTFRNSLRFPTQLKHEFRRDFGERQPAVLGSFFAFGLALYMSFGILDYLALPFYYPTAWALRLVFGLAMLRLIFHIETPFFRRNILWIPAAWTFWAGLSILIMIYIARVEEPAYIFYAFGLLLIVVAVYVPSSGDLIYPAIAGWTTVLAYMWIGILRKHMLLTPELARTFLVISFFLVGMNLLCMIGGRMLVVSQRRDFLQRRLIQSQRLAQERLRAQADSLLLNVLPASVAARLKRGEVVADVFQSASILFADMVNFTPLSSHLALPDLVGVLNQVFSEFDVMAGRLGLERIKTMGDGYLVAAGVPEPRPDHAAVLVQLGLEMCAYFNSQTFAGQKLGLRVGINSGPIVAAVIGAETIQLRCLG